MDAEGEIVTHKGACFLDLVHELVGDSAFWEELQLYTSQHWGQAAASEDFQKAFATISGGNSRTGKKKGADAGKKSAKTLDNLFSLWVYGISSTPVKKKK